MFACLAVSGCLQVDTLPLQSTHKLQQYNLYIYISITHLVTGRLCPELQSILPI